MAGRERPTEILIRLDEKVTTVFHKLDSIDGHLDRLNGAVSSNKENIAIIKAAREERGEELHEIKAALKQSPNTDENKWNLKFVVIGGLLGAGGVGIKAIVDAMAG